MAKSNDSMHAPSSSSADHIVIIIVILISVKNVLFVGVVGVDAEAEVTHFHTNLFLIKILTKLYKNSSVVLCVSGANWQRNIS